MSPTHKTQIICAIIVGVIGTWGAAVITSWDKKSPPLPDKPEIAPPREPTCKAKRNDVGDREIRTSSADVIKVSPDSEIDSDDWTRVSIRYKVAFLQNKTVVMTLVWEAQELNSNRSNGNTRITSRKQITLFEVSPQCTNSVITGSSNLDVDASQTQVFGGEQHELVPFQSSVGNLRDISVRFDGPGRSDDQRQQLVGVFRGFNVNVSETP